MRFGRGSRPTQPADIHERIARDCEAIFEQDGAGEVEQRIDVLRAVLRREGHFAPEDVLQDLEASGHEANAEFVAQTLDSFVRYGLASEIRTAEKPVRYEHVHLQRHHDHVVCVRCGRIEEIELGGRRWPRRLERSTAFRVLHAQVQLRGLCPHCLSGRSDVFPLGESGIGEKLEVVRLEADAAELNRLVAMGLRTGTRIEVLSHDGAGGSIVALDQSRMALPQSAHDRVLVRAVQPRGRWGRRRAIPLTDLDVGLCGRIVRMRGHGPMRHRLIEMGITRGATVFVERVAPLGDPMEVTVRGYQLAIRKSEASRILVEPMRESSGP